MGLSVPFLTGSINLLIVALYWIIRSAFVLYLNIRAKWKLWYHTVFASGRRGSMVTTAMGAAGGALYAEQKNAPQSIGIVCRRNDRGDGQRWLNFVIDFIAANTRNRMSWTLYCRPDQVDLDKVRALVPSGVSLFHNHLPVHQSAAKAEGVDGDDDDDSTTISQRQVKLILATYPSAHEYFAERINEFRRLHKGSLMVNKSDLLRALEPFDPLDLLIVPMADDDDPTGFRIDYLSSCLAPTIGFAEIFPVPTKILTDPAEIWCAALASFSCCRQNFGK
jgi:hypothetical protein